MLVDRTFTVDDQVKYFNPTTTWACVPREPASATCCTRTSSWTPACVRPKP